MFRMIVAIELVVLLLAGGLLLLQWWRGPAQPSPPAGGPRLPAEPRLDDRTGLVLIAPSTAPAYREQGIAPRRPGDRVLQPDEGRDLLGEGQPLPSLRDPRVLVEKSALRLTVLDGDRPVKQYVVAVGEQPGDKQREGDMRTPEGEFYICTRLGRGQTPYHRSLGLSYPDVEDAQRGLREGLISQAQHDQIVWAVRNRRVPPWNTPLGGAIMIHGARDGRTGTQGCVALDDADIEELFDALPMGTPVIIRP